jgi:hypothetical protein
MNITASQNTENYIGSKADFAGWFNEAIWGHRLQRQPASALLLEFLSMAEAMHRCGNLLKLTQPADDCRYSANRSIPLRSLLFNNPRMDQIRDDCQGSDDEAWDIWLADMKNRAAVGDTFTADFSYLRPRFHAFRDLVSRVALLSRIAMDPGSGRNWAWQLLFPIGPAALYEPCNDSTLARDRELFTRTGELAYLMLTRASEPLRHSLAEKFIPFFDPKTSRNNLVMSLLPGCEPDRGSEKGGTYLPYKTHPAFDRLAQDILSLLSLGLPDQDVFEHLKPIIAFNLYLYSIETANHWLGKDYTPVCACEIPGPKMDLARRASLATKEENEGLGLQAVRRLVEQALISDSTLNAQLASADFNNEMKAEMLADHMAEKCSLETADIKGSHPDEVRQKVIALAEAGFRDGVMGAIQGLGQAAGFTDKRGTNKIRYAPTDKLLRALVLANVTYQVEEEEFLRRLNLRYHLVIGPREAVSELPEYFHDEGDFKKNRERFTRRLTGLGIAQRMSDACTYVRNPYFRE